MHKWLVVSAVFENVLLNVTRNHEHCTVKIVVSKGENIESLIYTSNWK